MGMKKIDDTININDSWSPTWTGRLVMRTVMAGRAVLAICQSSCLEKAVAAHCSTLAWRSPGTGEPGGLPSVGSHTVGHD